MHNEIDYNENPFTVIWETTRACELQCSHCRTEPQYEPHKEELTYEDGINLIDEIYEMNNPTLTLTGGDCMLREDLYDLAKYAINKGMNVSITPCATRNVTKEKMIKAKEIGLSPWTFSIDGPTPEIHDYFWGTPGSFDLTIKKIHSLNELKMPLQINTVITRYNYGMLEEMAKLVAELKATVWNVYTLVPTKKEQIEDCITPLEHEKLFEWLYKLNKMAPYDIKTVASQHYYRVVNQEDEGNRLISVNSTNQHNGIKEKVFSKKGVEKLTSLNINDGNGIMFISHIGDVFPSELLRVKAGNVKEKPLKDIYRHSEVFTQLRNPDEFRGKCGKCEYRYVCGGSRSRAFAVTGDYLASEPFCVYVPNSIRTEMKKCKVNDRK